MKREREDSGVIKLNVGGTYFTTLKTTLTSQDSSLTRIVLSEIPFDTDDEGCCFVDLDPDDFRYILYFLRLGRLHLDVVQTAKSRGLHSSLDTARYLALSHYQTHFDAIRNRNLQDIWDELYETKKLWQIEHPPLFDDEDEDDEDEDEDDEDEDDED